MPLRFPLVLLMKCSRSLFGKDNRLDYFNNLILNHFSSKHLIRLACDSRPAAHRNNLIQTGSTSTPRDNPLLRTRGRTLAGPPGKGKSQLQATSRNERRSKAVGRVDDSFWKTRPVFTS
jgi:hypothetical protein